MTYQRDSKKQIWVSTEVYRWLWLVARSRPSPDVGDQLAGHTYVSPDEIADELLRSSLNLRHPKLAEGLKKIETVEKQIIEELRK